MEIKPKCAPCSRTRRVYLAGTKYRPDLEEQREEFNYLAALAGGGCCWFLLEATSEDDSTEAMALAAPLEVASESV